MSYCVVMPVSGPITGAFDDAANDYPIHVTLQYFPKDPTPEDLPKIVAVCSETVFPTGDGTFLHVTCAPQLRSFGAAPDPLRCLVALIPFPDSELLTQVKADFRERLALAGVPPPDERFPTYVPHVTLGEYPIADTLRRTLTALPEAFRACTLAVPLLQEEGEPVTAAGFTEDDHPRDDHGKFTSDGGEASASDEKSAPPARTADEVMSWPKVPGPLGSQGGTWHRDPNTDKVYLLKPTKDLDHAQNEVAAGKVYQAAGVPFPNTFVLSDDKQNAYTLSEKIPDLKQLTEAQWKADPELQAKAAQNFGTDALLSHWDVLGLSADNTLVTQDGTPVRIESGGAMSYRAMGGPKDSFAPGKPWVEPSSMRTSDQGKVMYGGMTDKQASQSLMKAALIDLDQVRQSWRDAGIPNHVSQPWYDTLRERQDQIPGIVANMLANPFATLPARRLILALVADACHMPAGGPDGGQFVPCDTPGAVDKEGNTPAVQAKAQFDAALLAKSNPGAGPLSSLKNTGPTKSQSVAYALWKLKNSPEGEKAAAGAKHIGNQTVYPYPGGKFKELVVSPNPDGKGHIYELVPQGQISQTLDPTQAVQEAGTTQQMADSLASGSPEVFSAAAQAASAIATPSPSVQGASEKTELLAADKGALLQEIVTQNKAGTISQEAALGYSILAVNNEVSQGQMAAVLTGEATFSSTSWETVDALVHDGTMSQNMAAGMLAAQAGGIQNPDSLAGQIDTKGIFGVSQEIADLGGMNAPPYVNGITPGPQATITTGVTVESATDLIKQAESGEANLFPVSSAAALAYMESMKEGLDPQEVSNWITNGQPFSQAGWEQVNEQWMNGVIPQGMAEAMLAGQFGKTYGEVRDLINGNDPDYQPQLNGVREAANQLLSEFNAKDLPDVPVEKQATEFPPQPVGSVLPYPGGIKTYINDHYGWSSSVAEGYQALVGPIGEQRLAQILGGEKFTDAEWAKIGDYYAKGILTVPEALSVLADQYPPADPNVLIDMADHNDFGELKEFAEAQHNELGGIDYADTDPNDVQGEIQFQVESGKISINEADAYNFLLQTAIDNPGDTPMSAGAIAAALEGKVVFNEAQWAFVAAQVEDGGLNTDQAEALVAHQFYGGQPNAPSDYLDQINENLSVDGLEQAVHDLIMSTEHVPEWNGPNDTSAGPLELQPVQPISFASEGKQPSVAAAALAQDLAGLVQAVNSLPNLNAEEAYLKLLSPSLGVAPVAVAAAVLGDSHFAAAQWKVVGNAYDQGVLKWQEVNGLLQHQYGVIDSAAQTQMADILHQGTFADDSFGAFNKAWDVANDNNTLGLPKYADPTQTPILEAKPWTKEAYDAVASKVPNLTTKEQADLAGAKYGGKLGQDMYAKMLGAYLVGKIDYDMVAPILIHQQVPAAEDTHEAVQAKLTELASGQSIFGSGLQPGVSNAQAALGNLSPQQLAASDLLSKLATGTTVAGGIAAFSNAVAATGTTHVDPQVAGPALALFSDYVPQEYAAALATGKSVDDADFLKAVGAGTTLSGADVATLTALQYGVPVAEVWKNAGLDPNDPAPLDMLDKQNLAQSTASQSFKTNVSGGQVYGDITKGIVTGTEFGTKGLISHDSWPTYSTKPSAEARQLIAKAKADKASREWHGLENGLPTSKFQFGNTVLTMTASGAEVSKLATLNRDGTLEAYVSPPPLAVPTVNVAGTPMSDSSALFSYQIPKAPEPVAPAVPPTGQQASTKGAGELPKYPRDVNGKPLSAGSREYKRFALLKQDLGYAKNVKHVDGPLQPADIKNMTSAKYGTSAIPKGDVVGYSRYQMHDGILTVMKMDGGGFRLAYTYGAKNYQSGGNWEKLQQAPGLKGTAAPVAQVMPPVPKGGIYVGNLDTSKAPNLIHGPGGSEAKVQQWGNQHFGSNGGKARYTSSEWNSLYKYGDGHYGAINGALRGGGTLHAGVSQDVANLDSALMRQRIPEGGVVTIRAGLGTYEQPLKDLPIGGLMRDKGFMSTSIGDRWSGNVRAVVEVPAGTPAAWSPGMAHPGEQEIVLPRNSTMVKTGDAYLQNGIWYVPMKLVAIGAEPVDVQAALNEAAGTTVSTGIIGTAGARVLRMLIEEAA